MKNITGGMDLVLGRFYSAGSVPGISARLLHQTLVPKINIDGLNLTRRNRLCERVFGETPQTDKNIAQYLLTLLIYLR